MDEKRARRARPLTPREQRRQEYSRRRRREFDRKRRQAVSIIQITELESAYQCSVLDWEPRDMDDPTDTMPGTPERVEVYRLRVLLGFHLFNPKDRSHGSEHEASA